jgi:hypothetical protein
MILFALNKNVGSLLGFVGKHFAGRKIREQGLEYPNGVTFLLVLLFSGHSLKADFAIT